MPRYVVITNPESLRWLAYEPDLRAFWREQRTEAEIVVVPWLEVITRQGNLDGLGAFDQPAIVRLESPGRNWEVAQHLLALGSGSQDFLHCPYRKGWLV